MLFLKSACLLTRLLYAFLRVQSPDNRDVIEIQGSRQDDFAQLAHKEWGVRTCIIVTWSLFEYFVLITLSCFSVFSFAGTERSYLYHQRAEEKG